MPCPPRFTPTPAPLSAVIAATAAAAVVVAVQTDLSYSDRDPAMARLTAAIHPHPSGWTPLLTGLPARFPPRMVQRLAATAMAALAILDRSAVDVSDILLFRRIGNTEVPAAIRRMVRYWRVASSVKSIPMETVLAYRRHVPPALLDLAARVDPGGPPGLLARQMADPVEEGLEAARLGGPEIERRRDTVLAAAGLSPLGGEKEVADRLVADWRAYVEAKSFRFQ